MSQLKKLSWRKWCAVLSLGASLLLSGCATPGAPDPFESFNRPVFKFNDAIDQNALKPAAQFYRDITPGGIRDSVNNFFDNLNAPYSAINNLLQFQFANAGRDIGRFLINSTFGILGLFDVAGKDMNIKSTREDFGQTLGAWGVGSGQYLVLPFLAPTNIRDVLTRFTVDRKYNLLPKRFEGQGNGYYAMQLFQAIRGRERILDLEKVADDIALDKYVLFRSLAIQSREVQVFNGRPPRVIEDESWLDEN